jgi:putative oxidoreductase
MKIAAAISRYLLAVAFIVFGLNGFLHFLPNGNMPALATQYVTVLAASHYTIPIFAVQLACGILFLINRYIPLALTLIGPVIVNILLFHILMFPIGIGGGVICTICWFILFAKHYQAFAGIFQARA